MHFANAAGLKPQYLDLYIPSGNGVCRSFISRETPASSSHRRNAERLGGAGEHPLPLREGHMRKRAAFIPTVIHTLIHWHCRTLSTGKQVWTAAVRVFDLYQSAEY